MRAIIFDMDGLLIDSEPLWKIAEIEGFGRVGLDLTATDCEESVGLRIDEVVKLWFKKRPWKGASCEEVTNDIVRVLIQEIKKQGSALPGVRETLEICKSEGFKIGLATSSYQNIIDAVLEKLEIGHYFDAIHSAEYEIHGKPHPSVFMTCAEKLGVNPLDCLVFEDSLNGVIAAKAARMKAIAVPEQSHAYNPKLIVADLIIESLHAFDIKKGKELFEE